MFEALFADWAPLDWIWFVYVGLMGACLGSFANVVIYRLPRGESVVRPRSRCGSCGTPISFRHNIPVLSWFLLRGKCASCGARYSFRYPAVEMLMAVLFMVAYLEMGWSWTLLESLIFIFSLVTVSFIDLDHMILPDTFTLSGIVIGLLGALLNPEREFLDSVYGVLLGGGFLWAIAYLYFVVRKREGMGGGDIKLLAWAGAVLGWKAVPFIILVASLLGSVVGIGMALLATRGRSSESATENEAVADDSEVASFAIPFGPFLALGALLYLLLDGAELARLYLEWHGLV